MGGSTVDCAGSTGTGAGGGLPAGARHVTCLWQHQGLSFRAVDLSQVPHRHREGLLHQKINAYGQ